MDGYGRCQGFQNPGPGGHRKDLLSLSKTAGTSVVLHLAYSGTNEA